MAIYESNPMALIAFFTMTDRPQTATWLSQTKKDLEISRIKLERVGVTQVFDKISRAKTIHRIFSPLTSGIALLFLFTNIAIQDLAFSCPKLV
jgi:hypothetical protein